MKILVIHASAGAGHQKAAEAIYNSLKKNTEHVTTLVDALDLSSLIFRKTYSQGYFFLISKAPWLWSFAFSLIDRPFMRPLVRIFRRINNSLNTVDLKKHLIDEQFDFVITTHFMPVEVVSDLKRKGLIRSKLITIVTDYDVHSIWLGSDVDIYCVATSWTQEKLLSMGVDVQKIRETGIPTDEKFSDQENVVELKNKLGIKQDVFTVLMATGSFGIGPIEEIANSLNGVQVMVVCGNNKTLYNDLKEKDYENVKPFPLINNMNEMMAVSDVMVTKPGGLSISEALVKGLPMIFFNAIPGQETNNIMVLSKFGIGFKCFEIEKIVKTIEDFKCFPERLRTSRQKSLELSRPNAVKDIIALIK